MIGYKIRQMIKFVTERYRNVYRVSLCVLLTVTPNSFAQTTETVADPPPVEADKPWEVCNETSFILRLATASMATGQMTVSGWTRLLPTACTSIDAPEGTPRFVYAESDSLHQGGIREWKGKANLCTDSEDFTADATLKCDVQNMSARGYLQIDPKQKRTALVEADNFGDKAINAGIQRLLRDNGYKISRIDGIMGRRTNRTLSKFLKSKDVKTSVSDFEKIAILAEAAKEKQDAVGLTFCNEAAAQIWTSIAYRDKSGWESRGWWPVIPGDCVRPYTENLTGKDIHYFALLEQPLPADSEPETPPLADKKLKPIGLVPSQFCVAESQFSAIEREYCSDKGYRTENFRAVVTEDIGHKIILLDSDFMSQTPSGLRR